MPLKNEVTMKKLILTAMLGVLLMITCAYGNAKSDDKLQKIISQEREKYQINAISLSVWLPLQETTKNYVTGTISQKSKTPIMANSLFQVGSITKNFTAVLMLKLVASGKITLDAPIGKYFPEYPKWQNITVRQLLNHTSGIYDYIDGPNWWEHVATNTNKIFEPTELLTIAYNHKPYFVANSGWHYSNTNYILLGLLIEKITAEPLSKSISTLLQSAGMVDSYYLPVGYSENILHRMAHGYYLKFDNTKVNGSWAYGAGALVSTPQQIVLWVHELFSGKILSWQSLELMENTVDLDTGKASTSFSTSAYGLGMFRMNTPAGIIWLTPGLTPGYRSLWVYMPCKGISFAYSASNSLIGVPFHVEMIRQIIRELLADKAVQQDVAKYQQETTLPIYCSQVKPAKKWSFVKF
jgi:D-alanyl-D-alanine carboxypeptidase